jgi:hypothetical protein
MVRLLTRVRGIGIETTDMLVHEAFVAQIARSPSGGALCRLTGSPDGSSA